MVEKFVTQDFKEKVKTPEEVTNCFDKLISLPNLQNLKILSLSRNQFKKVSGPEEIVETLLELLMVRKLNHDGHSTKEVFQYVLKCPVNLNLLDGELNTDDSMVDEVLEKMKEGFVGISEELEEWVPEVLGVEGYVCF